jgi:integrase
MRLTKTAVASLKAPDPSGKPKLHFDDTLRGFGVLCSGKTATKSYVCQRDLAGGKTRRVTIAPVNVISLTEARDKAAETLLSMHRGIDPRKERKAATARAQARQTGEITLRQAFTEFLANRPALRAKTRQSYADALKHLDAWLDRPLRGITRADIEQRHKAIAAEVADRRGTSGAASSNSAMRALRAVWNFSSERCDSLPPCPVKLRKQWFHEPRRETYVPATELPAFYAAVQSLQNGVARDFLLLLLFCGMRRGEAASLRWADVDFESGVIRIPAARTKGGHGLAIPVSDYVLAMLKARRGLGDLGGWVFPAASRSGHLEEPKFALKLVAGSCGVKISPHDLRRSFLSVAESLDLSPYVLKSLVGHATGGDVTAGYIQLSPERLRAATQAITDKILRLCGR